MPTRMGGYSCAWTTAEDSASEVLSLVALPIGRPVCSIRNAEPTPSPP